MIASVLLIWLLAAVVFLGGQHGFATRRTHQYAILVGGLVLIAVALPSLWMTVGLLWFAWHVTRVYAHDRCTGEIELLAKVTAAWGGILAAWLLTDVSTINFTLNGLLLLTVPWAIWTLISQFRFPSRYERWIGPVCVHEEDPKHVMVGQGNINHTEAVSAILAAVSLGLTASSTVAWVGVLCAILPMLCERWNSRKASQGDVYMGILGLSWLLHHGWVTWWLLVLAAIVFAISYRREISPRLALIIEWWKRYALLSPWQQIGGAGIHAWSRTTLADARPGTTKQALSIHPHNEWLSVLYEYGVLGAVCLVGTVAALLWNVREDWALFNYGLMLCVVACLQAPWTFYLEFRVEQVYPNGQVFKLTQTHGNVALNVLSAIWLVLALRA